MNKKEILNEIFNNDPFGLLKVKPKKSYTKTADERLITSFNEINDFIDKNGKEPEFSSTNISERQLFFRLNAIKDDSSKMEVLTEYDKHGLLKNDATDTIREYRAEYSATKEIKSFDDIFNDDKFNILGGNFEGLFDFKHTPKNYEREKTDFVARRKPCKDFDKYKSLFQQIQNELAEGKRELTDFVMGSLSAGNFYVHKGVLFYLESVDFTRKEHYKKDGTRVREDGRTRCIFENGTESNMYFRSVSKALYANGKTVTENMDKVRTAIVKQNQNITDEDKEAGFIYVLSSLSTNSKIASIKNLYKIGFSKVKVEERIKNAEKDTTFLMAPVRIIAEWECYNLNPQKLELLVHKFFGNSCLSIDVFDEKGNRHTPREWFIAPIEVIEEAIDLIVSGEVINYRYDSDNECIVRIRDN